MNSVAIFKLIVETQDLDDVDLIAVHKLLNARKITHQFRFDLGKLTEERYMEMFRFSRQEIEELAQCLNIPNVIVNKNRSKVNGIEGLCIFLHRFAYPNRLTDLTPVFGYSKTVISYTCSYVLNHIYNNFKYLLTSLDQRWLNPQNLDKFVQAIQNKGAPLKNCWGFIDGASQAISRPGHLQREVLGEDKHCHTLKFQSVVTPNGLIVNLFGPVPGRRHDSFMLFSSQLLQQLEERMNSVDGVPLALYGEPDYPLGPHLIGPFRGAIINEHEQQFNEAMSSVGQCVEWELGKLLSLFALLDFKKNLKLYLQPVAKFYLVGAILKNCHTCLNGSETGTYFNLAPPTLQEYLLGLI